MTFESPQFLMTGRSVAKAGPDKRENSLPRFGGGVAVTRDGGGATPTVFRFQLITDNGWRLGSGLLQSMVIRGGENAEHAKVVIFDHIPVKYR
jgi:hypothetical protein